MPYTFRYLIIVGTVKELVQTTWANIVEISLRVVSLSALLWCLGLLPRQWHQDFVLLSLTKTLWLFIAMIFVTFNLKTLTNNFQTWCFDNFEVWKLSRFSCDGYLIEGYDDPHLTLGDDEGPCLWAERVVERNVDHGVAVEALHITLPSVLIRGGIKKLFFYF